MGVSKYCSWLAGVKEYLGLAEESLSLPAENPKDMMVMEEAKLDWQIAKRYFNEVTEPALIDFAIYNMEAAERRLVHLIKMFGNKYPDGIWPPEFTGGLKEADKENENVSLTEG